MRFFPVFLSLSLLSSFCQGQSPASRVINDFNAGWKFLPGDAPHAEQAALDDSAWRSVAVPHDWSIAGRLTRRISAARPEASSPPESPGIARVFHCPPETPIVTSTLSFDGVMANSDVWGQRFSSGPPSQRLCELLLRPDRPSSFRTSRAQRDCRSAAHTQKQPASRWYEGGGIYRPVRPGSVAGSSPETRGALS